MIFRLFAAFIVVIAVAAGLAFISLPHDQLAHIVRLRDFFDVSIPVLGFGALVKYLCSCKNKCSCGECSSGYCAPGKCKCSPNCNCPAGKCTCKS